MILRWCPFCLLDSIIGHGWRRKQAHDERHDWIRYRRGLCPLCSVVFSFLPAFSLPYTHYSLVARSEALRRRFVEWRSWENATPSLKDPNRVPDASTLRRWFHALDCSRPAFGFLRLMLQTVAQWLARGEQHAFGSLPLSWPTIYACLQVFWPWPLRLLRSTFSPCPPSSPWDLRPKFHTVTLGELWMPWARTSNGSNNVVLAEGSSQ